MLNLLVRTTAFCILLNMCLPLPYPTTRSYLILSLSPFEYPPRVSVTIITSGCFISKPGYCRLSFIHSGAYFKVFSSSFCWRLSTQGQLISKSVILLLSLSTILVSTLLASTSVWSTYTGTSQKAVMWLFSYIGLGCVGKYQGGTDSISLMTEKIWIKVNLIQWLQIPGTCSFEPFIPSISLILYLSKLDVSIEL